MHYLTYSRVVSLYLSIYIFYSLTSTVDVVCVSFDHSLLIVLPHSAGVDSVMVDGSALPLEGNIRWTKRMARLAHDEGVYVEAELGRLAGEEVDAQ
jgi:fructose/tagatose bisphosphate aldolase